MMSVGESRTLSPGDLRPQNRLLAHIGMFVSILLALMGLSLVVTDVFFGACDFSTVEAFASLNDFCFVNLTMLGGIVLGVAAVLLTLAVYKLQHSANERLQSIVVEQHAVSQRLESVLVEEPTDEAEVVSSVIELLQSAREDPESEILFMAYWLWFGIDVKFPQTVSRVSALSREHADVATLLRLRIAAGLKTYIVILDDEVFLRRFIKGILEYRVSEHNVSSFWFRKGTAPVSDDEVESLLNRYLDDLSLFEDTISRMADSRNRVQFVKIPNIPSLIFVRTGGLESRAIYYVGELDAVVRHARLGGFIARNRRTVAILADQVRRMMNNSCDIASEVML